jgi:hypothetical protein
MGHSGKHGPQPGRRTMGETLKSPFPLGWFGEAESTSNSTSPSSRFGVRVRVELVVPSLSQFGQGERSGRTAWPPINRGRGVIAFDGGAVLNSARELVGV